MEVSVEKKGAAGRVVYGSPVCPCEPDATRLLNTNPSLSFSGEGFGHSGLIPDAAAVKK